MATRGRFASFDEDLLAAPVDFDNMDGLMASSWPAAQAPPKFRQGPPRAPLRKPSSADWEVPPLLLPQGPRKRSNSGSSTTREDAEATLPPSVEEEDEEDAEACVFGFEDGGANNDDEDDELDTFQLELVGLDDPDQDDFPASGMPARSGGYLANNVLAAGHGHGASSYPGCGYAGNTLLDGHSPVGSLGGRTRQKTESFSVSPNLGASPVLLSALERVAAEAGKHEGGGRSRTGTL